MSAEDYKPKVSFSSEKDKSGFTQILRFDDSKVVLKCRSGGESFRISEDNGVSWNEVELPTGSSDSSHKIISLSLDKNHKANSAYLSSNLGVYSTDDKGRSWKELHFFDENHHPMNFQNGAEFEEIEGMPFANVEIESHPLIEKVKIINVEGIVPGDEKLTFIRNSFFSTNGVDFTSVVAKSRISEESKNLNMYCSFALKSKKSSLTQLKDLVLCHQTPISNAFDEDVSSRFFFTDTKFKELTPFAEYLQEFSPSELFISENHLYILTVSDRFNKDSPGRLWRLEDGSTDTFEEIPLGTQIRKSFVNLDEIDGRVVITILHRNKNDKPDDKEKDGPGFKDLFSLSTEALISDSYGKNFRFLSFEEDGMLSLSVETSTFVKKTMFATWADSTPRFGFGYSRSKVSFDLGNTWNKLNVNDPEGKWTFDCDITSDTNNCGLQILFMRSVNMFQDAENFFTPGIISAVGSVNEKPAPLDFSKIGTFISRDDGKSWEKALDFPCRIAMGDYGNIILAVPFDPASDKDEQSEFYYSLDQGKTFQEYQLDRSFYPVDLSPSALDGSGDSFMLLANSFSADFKTVEFVSYVIDFSGAFEGKTCNSGDLEDWYYSGGQCIDGAKIKFRRRKQDSQCLIKTIYKDLSFVEEVCDCSEADYECADDFSIDANGNCMPDSYKLSLKEKCAGKSVITLDSKKITKVTQCKNRLNIKKEEINCAAIPEPSSVKVTENKLSSTFKSYQYFDTYNQESILFRTDKNEAYGSLDGGETLKKLQTNGEDVLEINFNPFFNSSAYLFGKNKNLFATHDYGHSYQSTGLPAGRQLGFPLSFHAKDRQTFIYYGGESCESFFDPDCHAVAYITRNGGESFDKLLEGASNCEFFESAVENPMVENGIVCLVKDKSTGTRTFVSSTDNFKTQTVLYSDVIGFMSTGDYLVVAVSYGEHQLRAYLTIDGVNYSEAVLPADLAAYEQKAFTVLGSQEGAIFMHMTTNLVKNQEFGALLKSNKEGTSFVVLERAVNRNQYGFVDFEKIQGLEGIILINVVSNVEDIVKNEDKGLEKKIKTKITFNDGADWTYIRPPSFDSKGKKYGCNSKNLEKCSLNLHGFTERKDVRDTYSSGSAIGYMFALGNVGEFLTPLSEASTFMTSDGGTTWTEVKKDAHQWEYGDHGGVLVLVKSYEPTNTVTYSTNGGKTWTDFEFSSEKVNINDIVTVPRDSALRFLLIGSSINIRGEESRLYTLDFVESFKRQCQYSKDNLKDFEYVSLSHPDTNECLFGHKAQYLRKKSDDCYVGMSPLQDSFKITSNCTCTRNDYECDYNFFRVSDGTCKLIDGLKPADPQDICHKDSSLIEYQEPTGYRLIPLSTCNGGLILNNSGSPKACPGKEKEFKEKYKIARSFFVKIWFLAVLFFTSVLTFIYYRGIQRNGGFARFGEIRLGEDDLIEENNTDRAVNAVLRNGVFLFSSVYSSVQYIGHKTGDFFKRAAERFGDRSGPSYQSLLHDQFLDDADDLLVGHDEDADDLASFIENEGNFEIGNEDEVDLSSELPTHAPYSDNPKETDADESSK